MVSLKTSIALPLLICHSRNFSCYLSSCGDRLISCLSAHARLLTLGTTRASEPGAYPVPLNVRLGGKLLAPTGHLGPRDNTKTSMQTLKGNIHFALYKPVIVKWDPTSGAFFNISICGLGGRFPSFHYFIPPNRTGNCSICIACFWRVFWIFYTQSFFFQEQFTCP